MANANGTVIITVTVNDGQSQNNTISRTFTVTVNPVNDPPSISNIADQATNEDTPISIPFTVGDPETSLPSLTVTVTPMNTLLIPATNIVINGSGAARTLTITPAPNTFGKSLITVVVSDGASIAADSFLVTVNAVNDPPTLDPLVDLSFVARPGEQTVSLTGISSGAANESQALTVSVTSSDTAMVPAPTFNYASPAAAGTISFRPDNKTGKATITVTVSDGGASNNIVTRTFAVYVRPAANEAPPTISPIGNRTINEGALTGPFPFTMADSGTPAELLTVSGASFNPRLVPDANIVFAGSGNDRTVTVTPLPNRSGTAVIAVTVADDNFGSTSTSFVLTVNSVNDLPTISLIADLVLNENSATAVVEFTIGDAETPGNALRVSATSSNPALTPNAKIIVGGSGAGRALLVTPATNQTGSATIIVNVTDRDGASANRSFVLSVKRGIGLTTITGISYQAGQATISFTTVSGSNYIVEYRSLFDGSSWTVLKSIPGDGGTMTVNDDSAPAASRIYRIRVE